MCDRDSKLIFGFAEVRRKQQIYSLRLRLDRRKPGLDEN